VDGAVLISGLATVSIANRCGVSDDVEPVSFAFSSGATRCAV
jgi:hypothetical protein